MSIYGPLVAAEDVRLALASHLRLWAPAYILEVGRQRGVDLPAFRGYTVETGDDFPVCITACAGTDDTPQKHGDGAYSALYAAGAAAVVSASTREAATALAGFYGLAIRALLLQQPALSVGVVAAWTGEALEEVAFNTERCLMACTERFTIAVDDVVNARFGPSEPPDDPTTDPGDIPEVELTIPTVIRS